MELPAALVAELSAHAEAAWPAECCGLIVGEGEALQVWRGRNIESSRTRFSLDDDTLLRVIRRDPVIHAIYHSHCDVEPTPSIRDRAGAALWPGVPWLILEVRDGRARPPRRWEL